jgi:hypothetical protein
MSGRFLVLAALALAACTSPEAERTRGGGPGADIGNRGNPVVMHEGSQPYAGTPRLIPTEAPSLEGARQARQLSRAQ